MCRRSSSWRSLRWHRHEASVSGPVNIGLSEHDHRVPDAVVVRERLDVVWVPTAAMVVEVISPGDETYAKFDFYDARGVEKSSSRIRRHESRAVSARFRALRTHQHRCGARGAGRKHRGQDHLAIAYFGCPGG